MCATHKLQMSASLPLKQLSMNTSGAAYAYVGSPVTGDVQAVEPSTTSAW